MDYFEKEGKVVLGERGRYLYSLQDNDYNSYSTDISAMGIWIDKILAMKYLVGRRVNPRVSYDIDWSFLDIRELVEGVTFLRYLIQDLEILKESTLKIHKGKKLYFPKQEPYKLDDSIHGEIQDNFSVR